MTGSGHDLLEHWPAMVRVCQRALGSAADAEDCASAALLSVVQRGGLGGVDNPEAWLVAVARRRAADTLRARAREEQRAQRLARTYEPDVADIADRVVDAGEARWLSAEADRVVPETTRRVVRAIADGRSVAEAADELGITKRAAESHLHRARVALRAVRAGALPAVGLWFAGAARRSLPALPPAVAAAAVGAAIVASPPATPEPAPVPPRQATTADAPARAVPAPRPVPPVDSFPEVDSPKAVAATAAAPRTSGTDGAPVRVGTASTGVDVTRERRDGPSDPVGIVVQCLANAQIGPAYVGC